MKFKKQSIKELLDKGASLIIDDELTAIELQELVKIAKKYNKDSKILRELHQREMVV